MITQRDVAKKLGISQMTVSRVINNFTFINQETRNSVLEEIRRSGYTLNINARNLISKRKGTIGIIIPGSSTVRRFSFFPILDGINEQVTSNNCNLLFVTVRNKVGLKEKLDSATTKVDGFIIFNFPEMRPIINEVIKYLRQSNKRFILIPGYRNRINAPYVTIDNFIGGYQATNHLIELGHKRIVYISENSSSPENRERLRGYMKACQDADILIKDSWVIQGIGVNNVSSLINSLFFINSSKQPTAIFAWSDRLARIIIYKFIKRGKAVPDDLSIVGFDDFQVFSLMEHPYLTTIRQPLYELGAEATKRILFIDKRGIGNQEHVVLRPPLIKRESCQKLR